MAGFELTPDEIKLFLDESAEQLQLMEESLIALEDDPENLELVQEIFRAAHTLKGGAATAGFTNMAELTHAMESLLDLVRQGSTPMTSGLADRLLKGVDCLRACLAAIEDEGTADGVDVEEVCNLLAGGDDASAPARKPSEKPPASVEGVQGEEEAGGAETSSLMCVRVQVSPTALMPSVRVYQALLAIEDHVEIVKTEPSRKEIEEDARDVREVRVYVAPDVDFEVIREALAAVPEVVSVDRDQPGETSSAPAAHPVEEPAQPKDAAASGAAAVELGQTIRVDIRLLDTLMNLVGELVIDRTRLVQLASAGMTLHELQDELTEVSGRLSRVTTDLQESIMHARMMPVDMLFKRFPRMMRDLSRQLGKPVHFEMTGQETELDRSVIEQIGDPLIHLLRNAIDHGIEPLEERRRIGKSDEGHVRLSAYHQENHIFIEIADDGRGLDVERLRRKAVERGLLQEEEAERLTAEECAELIFLPGLSTAEKVSSVSGRGVGMDVVKRNIEKVNGSVAISTKQGEGTVITIRLPLTLAILQALMVEIAGEIFAIPLSNVVEAVQITSSDIHRARGWEMIAVRGDMVPLLNPSLIWGDAWSVGEVASSGSPVVVLRSGGSPLGLKVDRLVGEQEIVIKTMGSVIGDVPGISGASILGDGRVALIMDPASLSKAVKEFARPQVGAGVWR